MIVLTLLCSAILFHSVELLEDGEFSSIISCPCGKSGKLVKVMCDHLLIRNVNAVCKTYSNCGTCAEGAIFCLTCPKGKWGPYCDEGTEINSTDVEEISVPRVARHTRSLHCPTPDSPKPGSTSCMISGEDRECTGRCATGHTFSNGDDEITLTCKNGGWQPYGSFPECVSGGDCDLEMAGAGSYNCTINNDGTHCDVSCHGRRIVTVHCQPGRPWYPQLPACIRAKHQSMAVANREPTCRCQNGGTCSNGVCQCPPHYSGRNCEVYAPSRQIYCGLPGYVANGERTDIERRDISSRQPYAEGSSVRFSCLHGYRLFGTEVLTCRSNGKWSAELPSCEREETTTRRPTTVRRFVPTTRTTTARPQERTCSDPGFIENGERLNTDGTTAYARNSFSVGTSVVYSCQEGYSLRGQTMLTCTSSGVWSRSTPECLSVASENNEETSEPELAYCEDPGEVPNGFRAEEEWIDPRSNKGSDEDYEYDENLFPQGLVLEYACRRGYTLRGESKITCLYTGQWSSPRPRCVLIKRRSNSENCDDPGYVINSQREVLFNGRPNSYYEDVGEKVPIGTQIRYTCDDGMFVVGNDTITCLPGGRWSHELPECHEECGRSSVVTQRRILNGQQTTAGEWPWQVAIAENIRSRSNIMCGGALINARTVITAAHCVDAKAIQRMTLYFGKYHLSDSKDDDKVIVRRPTNFIIHPDYNSLTFDYDIALIRFPLITTSNRIQPICLPTPETTERNLVAGRKGYVVGWGLTEDQVQPDRLLMAQIPFVPKKECEASYREEGIPSFPITKHMYCAGYAEGRTDSCTGDSGGPVSYYDSQTDRFVLEGLVSYGVRGGCGLKGRYTVYTKVGSLMNWVLSNTRL